VILGFLRMILTILSIGHIWGGRSDQIRQI
jgi:hypothetical protein